MYYWEQAPRIVLILQSSNLVKVVLIPCIIATIGPRILGMFENYYYNLKENYVLCRERKSKNLKTYIIDFKTFFSKSIFISKWPDLPRF